MRTVIASLLGVPATILLAAGGGLVGITILSWFRPVRGRRHIGWRHLGLGVALGSVGVGLLAVAAATGNLS